MRADVRVRYQDQSQTAGAPSGLRLATWVQAHSGAALQSDPAVSSSPYTASRSVTVTGRGAASISSGTSASALLLYGVAGVAVLGAVAAVALAVVAVRRRRRAREVVCSNNESVLLGLSLQQRCANSLTSVLLTTPRARSASAETLRPPPLGAEPGAEGDTGAGHDGVALEMTTAAAGGHVEVSHSETAAEEAAQPAVNGEETSEAAGEDGTGEGADEPWINI